MAKIFKNGKYKGKKADWVKSVDPNYYRWAMWNAPGLVVDTDAPREAQFRYPPMKPNENFENEGPWEPPV